MKRALVRWAALVGLVAVLAACTTTAGPAGLQFSLGESGTLGYEVDDSGAITITSRLMRFQSSAGEVGRTLTRYRIAFFDGAGAAVNGGDNVQFGSMSLFVPPGIQCAAPDAVLGCTLGSEGARFAVGPQVSSQAYNLMPADIAQQHLLAGSPVGWHALIRFDGQDARGIPFTTTDYRVAVSPPD